MALTKKQREEMRKCVVGPCTSEDFKIIRDWLLSSRELVQCSLWGKAPEHFNTVEYFMDTEVWDIYAHKPNISFQDFKTKYIDATK